MHLPSSCFAPVSARVPAPVCGNMSEGVDLIDIYADEEFNQVSGTAGCGAGGADPPLWGENIITGISQLVSVDVHTGWCICSQRRQRMQPECPGKGGTALESPCGEPRPETLPKSWWLPSRAGNKRSFCGFHRRFNTSQNIWEEEEAGFGPEHLPGQ